MRPKAKGEEETWPATMKREEEKKIRKGGLMNLLSADIRWAIRDDLHCVVVSHRAIAIRDKAAGMASSSQSRLSIEVVTTRTNEEGVTVCYCLSLTQMG